MNKTSAALMSATLMGAAALVGRRYAPSPDHPATAAWYAGLRKSPLTPPGPVFGGAWGLLYPLLGWAGYRLLSAPASPQRSQAIAAWGWNIVGIAAHPYLLFGRKKLGPSTVVLTAEAGAAIALVATASRVDGVVAAAQIPLALWVAYADLLN